MCQEHAAATGLSNASIARSRDARPKKPRGGTSQAPTAAPRGKTPFARAGKCLVRRSHGVFSRRGATRNAKISVVTACCRVARVPRETVYRKVGVEIARAAGRNHPNFGVNFRKHEFCIERPSVTTFDKSVVENELWVDRCHGRKKSAPFDPKGRRVLKPRVAIKRTIKRADHVGSARRSRRVAVSRITPTEVGKQLRSLVGFG